MSKKHKEAKRHPDRELIEACMSYCAGAAAATAMFKADPDGDSAFAERMEGNRGRDELKRASKLEAKTMYGLSSKARAALYMLDCDLRDMGSIDSAERGFLRSLAADTKRLADIGAEEEGRTVRAAALTVAKAVAA